VEEWPPGSPTEFDVTPEKPMGIYIIYPSFKGTFGAKVVEVSNWQVTSSLRWVGGRGWEGWVKR